MAFVELELFAVDESAEGEVAGEEEEEARHAACYYRADVCAGAVVGRLVVVGVGAGCGGCGGPVGVGDGVGYGFACCEGAGGGGVDGGREGGAAGFVAADDVDDGLGDGVAVGAFEAARGVGAVFLGGLLVESRLDVR